MWTKLCRPLGESLLPLQLRQKLCFSVCISDIHVRAASGGEVETQGRAPVCALQPQGAGLAW